MATDLEQNPPAELDLKMERVKSLVEQIKGFLPGLEEIASTTQEIQNDIQQQVAGYALSLKTTKLKPEELESFFRKPYLMLPVPGKRENWWFIIPRFVDVQIGWLDRQTEAYNVFGGTGTLTGSGNCLRRSSDSLASSLVFGLSFRVTRSLVPVRTWRRRGLSIVPS